MTCARLKPDRSGYNGLLHPLQQAQGPYTSISVDFIVGLPLSGGFDLIMVVVDWFTKYAIFIPCHTTLNALSMSHLFVKHVFTSFGLPQEIISDRGPQFTSRFWESLLDILGIKPCRSTAYHPQSDGQTKRVNQTLEQHLRCYATAAMDSWAEDLPIAQFAYNNATHASTGTSPFQATIGYSPSLSIGPTLQKHVPAATEMAVHIKAIHKQVQATLTKSIQAYKKAADKNRRPAPAFPVGSLVMLDASNICMKVPSRKFGPKRLGPFKVLEDKGNGAFVLDLPPLQNTQHV